MISIKIRLTGYMVIYSAILDLDDMGAKLNAKYHFIVNKTKSISIGKILLRNITSTT